MADKPINQGPSQVKKLNNNSVAIVLVAAIVGAIGFSLWLTFEKSENPSPNSSATPPLQPTNLEIPVSAQKDFTPDEKNEVFIATTEEDVLNVLIFNPMTNKVIASKKITLDATLGAASTNAYGANDSVQYNPKTKEIIFFTQGYSDYDGSCENKDDTCTSRLYKISWNQTKPLILFESNKPFTNWVINSFDNSILLSFLEGKNQTLKKISAQDGDIIFTKDYEIKENTELTDFVLSKDGKYTYQTSRESVDGKWFYQILRLRKITNTNGNLDEQDIFGGEAIDYETNLSPDNHYLAFYSGVREPAKLYIYEIPTKKLINVPYQGSIGNYNLIWSGDSKKLLHLLKDSLSYYDISSAKSTLIPGDTRVTPYVYAWAPSVNYFVYLSEDMGIKIFDVKNNQVIDTRTKARAEVKGVSWF